MKMNPPKMRNATLCYLVEGNRVLLGMKKRGFGQGKWNGFGGKVESDESIEDAMMREAKEEIGVELTSMRKVGRIDFYSSVGQDAMNQHVHVFVADSWDGNPTESEEMAPKWFANNEIPLTEMWPDDKYWLNDILSGKMVNASFLFNEKDEIVEHQIIIGRDLF